MSTYADGLPRQIAGVIGGGVADIAFRGPTAYVLVNGVSEFWTELIESPNAPAAEGIYRLDRVGSGTTRATLIADIYTWSEENPPLIQLLHPGRIHLRHAALSGRIPGHRRPPQPGPPGAAQRQDRRVQGLRQERRPHRAGARRTTTVLSARPGRCPHAATGRVVARHRGGAIEPLASGAPLLVDVEVGPQDRLYGLAQGDWPYEGEEGKEGFPAAPHTGHLMLANHHGQFQSVVSGLDRPTTFEIIGSTMFVVTITGKVLRITGLGR